MTQYSSDFFFKVNKFEHIKSIVDADTLGYNQNPEIVFLGSSNAGKSTLINAVTLNKNMARTSKKPGKTQTINIFTASGKFNIVDAPGYGYAQAPIKNMEGWGQMMLRYLENRSNLLKAFVLINAVTGYKTTDLSAIKLLQDRAIPCQIVITKKDKLRQGELYKIDQIIQQTIELIKADNKMAIVTSALKKEGIAELQKIIYKIMLRRGYCVKNTK